MIKNNLAIYAVHPVMYQTPIFSKLQQRIDKNKIPMFSTVLFGDDLSLREVHFKEINTSFKPDTPFLLSGYRYKFLKNHTKDSRGGFWSRLSPEIFSELSKGKYDAILIHGYENATAWLALLSSKLLGINILWRGEAVLRGFESQKSLKNWLKRTLLTWWFRQCDAVMYSCSGNYDYLRFYGCSDNKLFGFPCAVNNSFFIEERKKNQALKNSIRAELSLPLNDLVLLFSARFTARKRPMDLLRAVSNIDHNNISILFVGDGPERKRLEELSSELGLRSVFVGFRNQSEISKYYSVADVNIIISDYDPSPKALNEAMNFSLPVIVTEVIGTARDLVKDGENGYIIKVGDIETLAQRIDHLQRHRSEIANFGAKSFAIVQEWNYEKDVDGILSAIEYVSLPKGKDEGKGKAR